MKTHTQLCLTAALVGAIVTSCSNPMSRHPQTPVTHQVDVPATHPASVPEIPLPLETPLKLEALPQTTQTQGTESSSPGQTHRAATIPVGVLIAVHTIESIDSRTDLPGQTYRALIEADITVANTVVIPRGSDAHLKLTRLYPAGFEEESNLRIDLDRIVVGHHEYPVSTGLVKQVVEDDGAKMPAQADGSTSVTNSAGVDPVIVPAESRLTFRLEQPLEIKTADLPGD